MSRLKLACVAALTFSGCALDEEPITDVDGTVVEHRSRDVLLQPGSSLIPLAVTDDDYVFYQDGASLYVSSLECGDERTLIFSMP